MPRHVPLTTRASPTAAAAAPAAAHYHSGQTRHAPQNPLAPSLIPFPILSLHLEALPPSSSSPIASSTLYLLFTYHLPLRPSPERVFLTPTHSSSSLSHPRPSFHLLHSVSPTSSSHPPLHLYFPSTTLFIHSLFHVLTIFTCLPWSPPHLYSSFSQLLFILFLFLFAFHHSVSSLSAQSTHYLHTPQPHTQFNLLPLHST